MAEAVRTYSSFFSCLYDLPEVPGSRYGGYSVFRAIDSRDVQQRSTLLPRIHDFAIIWDDDHDTRIIPVVEEMLMAGLLPGVQFIGEHKGTLTIILAAPTWSIDTEEYARRVESLSAASGDSWNVRLGSFDNTPSSLRTGHQCDFQQIVGLSQEEEHAFLLTIDSMWRLGTKEWSSIDVPEPPTPISHFFGRENRYRMRRPKPRP